MRSEVPSRTAAWVAAMRSAAAFLPASLRLVDDPYGLRFAGPLRALRDAPRVRWPARLAAPLWLRGRLRATVVLMQLRTRTIDEDVLAFVQAGGAQVVLLGAGFDCRAWRLPALAGAAVFEVDHPATQAAKRAAMASEPTAARVLFVPWDFEQERLDRLPAHLELRGLDRRAPTLILSEGVLPYLTADAVDATFACARAVSGPGSRFTFTYLDRALLADRSREPSRERLAVRLLGEPFLHGFDPAELPRWLAARGFALARDESAPELAARLLPDAPAVGRLMATPLRARRHFASATILTR